MRRCTGLRSRLSYFSIAGVELHAPSETLAGYKLADLADEALSLVKTLGIKQYVLVGHSMGGSQN
jgi:pimeloyl-ACP methyl ester carboxylesterase